MAIKKFNTVAGLSVGENADIEVIDNVGNVAANNFTVSGISDLGPVESVTITGGSSGSLLATDGSGNLFWTPPNPTQPAGISTSVQYNDSGALAGDSVFVYYSNTGTLYTTAFSGSGASLTNLPAANIVGTVASATTATVAGTVTGAAQSNITSVGALTGLTVSGTGDISTLTSNNATITGPLSVTGNTVITGNLTVTGAAVYANVTSLNIKDPLILQGGNPNGVPLTSNDGFDRGAILNYYTTQPMSGFIGYDNSAGIFVVANDVGLSDNIVTINTYGDFKASSFIGSGQYLTNLNGANVTGEVANATYATTAGSATTSVETVTVTASAQPNITSLGTLTGLNVDSGVVGLTTTTPIGLTQIWNQGGEKFTLLAGSVTDTASSSTSLLIDMSVNGSSKFSVTKAGVVNATGLNAANIVAPGSDTNILFNHTGYVNAAAGLTFNHNTNVFTVLGNTVAQNASLGNLATANYFSGDGRLLTNLTGSQVTGTVASATNATTAGTVTTASQPNITSVGTLTGLTSTGTINLLDSSNVSLGNIVNLHIDGGINGYVLSTDGAGTLSWVTQTGGGGGTPGGSDTQLQYNDAGNFGGTPNITYTAAANRLNVTNVAVTTSITRNGRNVTTFTTASNAPSNPLAGDQWYDSDNDRVYQYMYDGVSYFWVDVSTGFIEANVSATAGSLVIRDGSGNIYGNVVVGTTGQFGNVSTSGNVNATYFIGDGSQLTGLPAGYSNANTASFLANLGSNGISTTGNISAGSVTTTGNVSGGNITTTGSVTGTGSNITLVAGVYSSVFDNTGNISLANGTVTLNKLTSTGTVSVANLVTAGSISATGNVSGAYFIGDGSQLTGLPAGYANANAASFLNNLGSNSISTTGNITADYVFANNISGTLITASQPNITTVGDLTSLTVLANISAAGLQIPTGNAVIGNLYVSGVTTIAGNITQISGNSGQFFGNASTGFNALYAGLPAGFSLLPQSVTNFVSTYDGYSQINNHNLSGGAQSTVDWVLTSNNGDDNTYYFDIGMTSSGFDGTIAGANNAIGTAAGPNDAYMYVTANVAAGQIGNLILATVDDGSQIRVAVGGRDQANVALLINSPSTTTTNSSTGTLIVTGGVGVNGNVYSAGNISGSYFIGNGSQLTGLPAGYANTDAAAYLASGTINTNIITTANVNAANLNASINVVGGNVISTNNMTVQGGTITLGTGVVVVDAGTAGLFNVGISNVTIGQNGNVTMGSLVGNVTARNNLIVGNLLTAQSANISTVETANTTVTNTLTAAAVKLNDLYSSRAPISVTTNTVIDSFAVNKYRSAKYTIRVGSDDGYQAVEVLLVHDNVSSIVTIYGSISTSGSDIITLSTSIAGGTTVQLIASSGSANTTVNLLGTYVAD